MRNRIACLTAIWCALGSTAWSTEKVGGPIAAAEQNAATQPLGGIAQIDSPLRKSVNQERVPLALRESVVALDLDEVQWADIAAKSDVLLAGIPLGPTATRTLVLHRVDPFANRPTCVGASIGKDGVISEVALALPALDCYLGTVLNDPDSHVLLSRGDGFIAGYVQSAGKTWVISSGRVGVSGPTISYAMDELPPGMLAAQPWSCEALLPPDGGGGTPGGIAGVQPCRQSQVAVDTDVEFLALFGGNQNAAIGYVGTLFAALSDIYSRDVALRPSASYIRLWTTGTDPWNATNNSAQLPEFRDHWETTPGTFFRNSAALLSGRGLGGGIAWLNAGCGSYAYSVSANLAGSFPYPIVHNSSANWDIMVLAHELGHNYGAPHTHNYVPPGDGCGLSPQDCTAATLDIGTIMSYCHTCPGGMSNIKLIFHEYSKESIDEYLTFSPCDFSAETQPPVAIADPLTITSTGPVDIDVLANDLPFNCESILLLNVTQPTQGGSTVIVPGAGPENRPIVRLTPPPPSVQSLSFSYQIGELSGGSALGLVTVQVLTVRAAEFPTGDMAGIAASYYALTAPTVLPNFDSLTPYATDTVGSLSFASTDGDFASSGRAENVGAVFSGWIDIPTTGNWTFFTNSDDGSMLFIGDTAVVLNDGLHGMVEKSGSIALGAGKHQIRTDFFERGGGAGLFVLWLGPNTPKATVPSSAWTHGGSIVRADINHDGLVNSSDLSTLLAAWGTNNPLADIDQNGIVNASDLSKLLVAWTP